MIREVELRLKNADIAKCELGLFGRIPPGNKEMVTDFMKIMLRWVSEDKKSVKEPLDYLWLSSEIGD